MAAFRGDDIDQMLESVCTLFSVFVHFYPSQTPTHFFVYGPHTLQRNAEFAPPPYSRGDRDRGKERQSDMSRHRGGPRDGYGGRGRDRGRGRRGGGGGRGSRYDRGRGPSLNDKYAFDPMEVERRRKEREQSEIERDQRTVFAGQIHPKCDERDIYDFFSQVGRVTDVQLIRDNRTSKSKGLCYIEFSDKSAVAKALSLSGQMLSGYPVSVQLTQAEKNRAAQEAAARAEREAQTALQVTPMKLYISNIPLKVTEEDIHPVFSAFGDVLSLEIKRDHRGKSKGYGFVEFKRETDAKGAMQRLNQIEILGKKVELFVFFLSFFYCDFA